MYLFSIISNLKSRQSNIKTVYLNRAIRNDNTLKIFNREKQIPKINILLNGNRILYNIRLHIIYYLSCVIKVETKQFLNE